MGFGWTEVILILGVILLIFGPNKLPKLARSLGESMNIFQEEIGKASSSVDDAKNSIEEEAAGITESIDVEETDKEAS